jgi:hypothetical protein
MFFDDPKNALSVARTHQRDLLSPEQRDRQAKQARSVHSDLESRKLSRLRQVPRSVRWWLMARVSRGASDQARAMHHLPK